MIEAAITKGANFIITHEPTFYNHLDETDWLVNDPIYQAKRKLIDDHGLVIWRFHDYWHAHQPDGIMIGVLRALGLFMPLRHGKPIAVHARILMGDGSWG